jgi:hypothetical protein
MSRERRLSTTRHHRLALVALVFLAASCTQLLGIEEARVDPSLTAPANTLAGGSGAGGSTVGGAGGSTADASDGAASLGGQAGQGGMAVDGGQNDGDRSDGGSAVCRQYCTDIQTFCMGNVMQYVDEAQCLKVCAVFPEGTVGGHDENTASCRMSYAGKARYAGGTERDAYCRKAGPGSDGTCGQICDGFCALMMPTCTQARTAPYFFSTLDVCLTTCRNLPDVPPYTVADGTLPDKNDAQCRLFHVTSAVMDPDEHCEHAMGVTMCDPKKDAGSDANKD